MNQRLLTKVRARSLPKDLVYTPMVGGRTGGPAEYHLYRAFLFGPRVMNVKDDVVGNFQALQNPFEPPSLRLADCSLIVRVIRGAEATVNVVAAEHHEIR